MTTISINELPVLVSKFLKDAGSRPLGIITNYYDAKDAVRSFLEMEKGSRRINNVRISQDSIFFDAEGNLLPGVNTMEQKLESGRKVNAARYLASRVSEYNSDKLTFLFAVHDVFTPQMGGLARYIARKTGRPLIALLPPVRDPESTYVHYEVVVCEK